MTSTTSNPTLRSRPPPPITGTKIVRFKIPSHTRRFTVHEDLICLTSSLFSRTLQSARKPLFPTSECCICTDALSPISTDISYCSACGQNMHESCIAAWKRNVIIKGDLRGEGGGVPTCPMCRATWKNEPMLKEVRIEKRLDAESVQAYIAWLYSSHLHITTSIDRKSDSFNLALLKCWAVASAMEDTCFKKVVLTTFFADAKARVWRESVHWAFVEGWADEEIRRFVVEVFMAFIKPGWFGEQADMWPDKFARMLADKALEGMERKMGYKDVRNKWLGKAKDTDEEVQEAGEEEEEETRLVETGDTDEEWHWDTCRSREEVARTEEDELPRRKRPRRQHIASDQWTGGNVWE